MHQNTNLLLKRIDNSQECFMNLVEGTIYQNSNRHVTVFYNEVILPPVQSNLGMFNLERALSLKGLTLANCLETARYLKSCIADKKVIYIWELEWMFMPENYEINVQSLKSADFVFCEYAEYKDALKNYAGVDSILSAFNLEKIHEICYR